MGPICIWYIVYLCIVLLFMKSGLGVHTGPSALGLCLEHDSKILGPLQPQVEQIDFVLKERVTHELEPYHV